MKFDRVESYDENLVVLWNGNKIVMMIDYLQVENDEHMGNVAWFMTWDATNKKILDDVRFL